MDKARFREELRGRLMDFAAASYLINLHKVPETKKEKDIEEKYLKLENWILGNSPDQTGFTNNEFKPTSDLEPVEVSEDQASLDF